MEHTNDEKHSGRWQKAQLVLALATAAVAAVMIGTLAWLNYQRGLFAVTKLQMPVLYLQDEAGNRTHNIELGNLDLSQSGSIVRPFSVASTAKTDYILQLGYTTNLPLNYKIIDKGEENQEQGTVVINTSEAGKTGVELGQKHAETYDTYTHVQDQAKPLYWQTEARTTIFRHKAHYYELVVSWDSTQSGQQAMRESKETEMIYVTVGTVGDAVPAATTGGN